MGQTTETASTIALSGQGVEDADDRRVWEQLAETARGGVVA